jgi:hypothetical protein
MGTQYREPAPQPPDPGAEERWREHVAGAKAHLAAHRIRRIGALAFVGLLLAGIFGGCLAAREVRGGDSPFTGLGEALERVGVGASIGLAAGLFARKAIVRRAQRRSGS